MTIVPLPGGHAASVRGLARWLAAHRPDAVLAIDAAASLKLATARFLGRAPSRIVLSYHGYGGIVRGQLGKAAYRLAPLLGRMSDRIVCVSEGLARHLVRDFHAPASRVLSIPNRSRWAGRFPRRRGRPRPPAAGNRGGRPLGP